MLDLLRDFKGIENETMKYQMLAITDWVDICACFLNIIDPSLLRTKVLGILPQLKALGRRPGRAMSISENVCLKNANQCICYGTSSRSFKRKIEENLNMLKTKLEHPVLEMDTNLYASLRINLESISSSDLTWKDPEGSMVLSDDSEIEPRENMKCILPGSVVSKRGEFMENFNGSSVSRYMGNLLHNKESKENEPELVKAAERILAIWSNPAFPSSKSRNDQSQGTYITDVVVPLLQASLGGLQMAMPA
nr:10476_t:CDS:2 [Entrophospora candida]